MFRIQRIRPVVCVLIGSLAVNAPANASTAYAARLHARRTATAPKIDGRLGDLVWREANVVSRFRQRSPREGATPEQRSELRVLYDDRALYVALRLWDADATAIRRGLGRRDAPPDSDTVTVALDALSSGARGHYFRINASGVLSDGTIYQQTQVDSSWDGVWSGAAQVDGRGWTAELRIPFSTLTHRGTPDQSWGLYVERYVSRNGEVSSWPLIAKSSNVFVARFGRLEGLTGLGDQHGLRLSPYAATAVQLSRSAASLRPGETFVPNGGLDLRYRLGQQIVLHATVNPDFGQVEDDPAVVNLGPDEVFFAERRPFFVAGAELFRTPLLLLHTRRIGARPDAPEPDAEGAEIVELDPTARIIGATKLLGTSGRLSFGGLSAVVLPVLAQQRMAGGVRVEREAATARHYAAARARWRLGETSTVGLIATGLTPLSQPEEGDVYAAGLTWDLRATSGWQATGQIAGATADAGTGFAAKLVAGQRGAPRWRYWLEAETASSRFDINAIGFLWRNDLALLHASAERRLAAPWTIFREGGVGLTGRYGVVLARPELSFERRAELFAWARTTGLWGVWAGGGVQLSVDDDRETRGGLPYRRPLAAYGWLGGETSSARRIVLHGTINAGREAKAPWFDIRGGVRASLWRRVTLSLDTRGRIERGRPRWVETVAAPDGDLALFGALDRDEIELKLGGMLALHRRLTLQLFGQLLRSTGRYTRYEALAERADGQAALTPTDRDPAADFTSLRLIANAIVRWELGEGATAHLVYKMDGAVELGGSLPLGDALSRVADQRQTHLLLLKLSYGFDV